MPFRKMSVGTTAKAIINYNKARLSYVIFNEGPNDILLSFSSQMAEADSFKLTTNSAFSVNKVEDGNIVTLSLYAKTLTGSSTVWVFESLGES